jgi:hypothetical protein
MGSEQKAWQVGDLCLAVYNEDQKPYAAVIDCLTIDEVGRPAANVTFQGYGNQQVQSRRFL